jgi:mannose-6-phosphate isomerase-like protein (cupin superfamily)
MPDDQVDRGAIANETPEMRKRREAIVAETPPPELFKLRTQLMKQGRNNKTIVKTEHMRISLKCYAGGGENGLHNHSDQDHVHIIMQGSAVFFGARGEEMHCGQYEGVLLPKSCYYRFHATCEEPLVLLRMSAKVPGETKRINIYGDPLPNTAKGNGKVTPVPMDVYWGAKED